MEQAPIENPQKVPFRCPVCNGFGTVKHGTLICQGCGGKGYVVIDQITGEGGGNENSDSTHQNLGR
jgi:RecJ-like exonuclease